MKKIVVVILALLMVVPMAACKPKKPPKGDDYVLTPIEQLDKNASIELTVAGFAGKEEEKMMESLMEGFNKTYPNITLNYYSISGNFNEAILKAFKAEEMPDIFYSSQFNALSLGNAKIVLNLDPCIEQDTEAGYFNVDDFYPEFWRQGQENFNGKQWMVPRAADQVVVHYNKKILTDAGVFSDPATKDLIKNGWTWDDFIKVLEKVRAYYDTDWDPDPKVDTRKRTLVDAYFKAESNFTAIFNSFGFKEFFDEEGNSLIDCQEVKNALNFMEEFVDSRFAEADNSANFAGGQGAFLIHSTASSIQLNNLKEVYKEELESGELKEEDIYDVVSFPLIGDSPAIGSGVAGYCISSTIEDEKLDYAWRFLEYMLTREGQNMLVESGANYPPIRKDMSDPKDPANNWGKGFEHLNLEAYTYASTNGYAVASDFMLIRPIAADGFMRVISNMIVDYIEEPDVSKKNKILTTCKEDLEYEVFTASY